MALAAAAMAVIAGAAAPARAGGARVLVWPRGPDDDAAGAAGAAVEAAVEAAGFTPVSFAGARERYLRQDGDAMAAGLAAAEAAALPVLAQPRHAAALWELELQRGLAELLRRDPEAAGARFLLALELDEGRAPRRELYGPDVARAFAEAADARAQSPPRPTALSLSPPDARVVIDGLAVVDPAAPRALRPGLHAIAAAAPGYDAYAAIVLVRSGEPIRVALAPAAGVAAGGAGGAIDRIGAAWAAGAVDAGGASGRRAIADAAAELGAAAAIVVEVDRGRGEARARVIGRGEAGPVARGATPAACAAAALAHLAPDGAIAADGPGAGGRIGGIGGAGSGGGGGRSSRSVLRAWWLWTAVGAVAVGIGAGVALEATREQTIRILPPPP